MATLTESMKGLASPRYLMLTIVGVSLLVVFSFLSYRLSEPVMSTLYSNLSAEDSAAVVTELGALGVKFEMKSGGSEILVQSPDVLRVRMQLAQKGLPGKASIVGYEIFDKQSMLGTSDFVMNVNLIRALEGELARTIASLNSIKSARVHLVIPRKDVFKKNNFEPTASVVLTLNNRLDVPREEAQAVRHIVSAAVPGLSPSKITIVDNNGKLLAKARSEDEESNSSADTADYKFQLEERYRNQINNMVEQVVGPGKVDTQISVDVSFIRTSEVSEKYDPDGSVPRSTQTSETVSSATNSGGGEVSVANELTGQAGGGGGGNENNQKTDEVTNYEISKTVTNKVDNGGTLKKISVAVLVDGSYSKDSNGNDVYAPRSEEQLDQIKTLVKSAIGYDETRGDKVDVVNIQFSNSNSELIPQEGPLDWLKRDLDSIIKTFVLGVVAILTIILVVRPLVNKAFDVNASDIEAQEIKNIANTEAFSQASAAISGAAGNSPLENEGPQINLDVIQSKIDYSPTQKVNDLIDNNPEETLSIIRSWLAESKG